jgi:hypothetical protein
MTQESGKPSSNSKVQAEVKFTLDEAMKTQTGVDL